MSYVDYEHVLQILENCALQGKSAQEAKLFILFAFGDPKKVKNKDDKN